MTKKDYSDAATPDVTYAFDPWFPRQTSRVDGVGTTTFTYHPYGTSTLGAGQVSLINGPLSNDTLKHTYDQLGRLKKLEIVDDATQTVVSYSDDYTFDTRARVTNVTNNLGAQTYTFVGQSNRPSTVTYANGMKVLYDYYTTTGDFMLKQIKNLTSGATPTVSAATTASVPAGFNGVSGGEVYRGETLLVSAYIVIWVILFVWIALIWKKQASLHSRLDELDRSIDRAIRAKAAEGAAKE